MNKEYLEGLLQTARQNERQALAALGWAQGRVGQIEELLAMLDTVDKAEENDSRNAKELPGSDS